MPSAHSNKARGIFDNLTPGLRQLGHGLASAGLTFLILPFFWIDAFWRNGAAGKASSAFFVLHAARVFSCFRTGYAWTGSRRPGWIAFLLFALNPPADLSLLDAENEPLMVLCATAYSITWSR